MEKFSAEFSIHQDEQILQPENGYRFSTDAILLATHILPDPDDTIIDIGTGCGIVPLILGTRYPHLDITGVEIQETLYGFAQKNLKTHHLKSRIRFIHNDINQMTLDDFSKPVDRIVSNPPYKKKGCGRLNPNRQKAIARHEITLDIDQLFECAKKLLKNQGSLHLIFPADRIGQLFSTMTAHHFSAKRMRFIHTKTNAPAKRVIVEAVKHSKNTCTISAPLYIYSRNGLYTKDYLSLTGQ